MQKESNLLISKWIDEILGTPFTLRTLEKQQGFRPHVGPHFILPLIRLPMVRTTNLINDLLYGAKINPQECEDTN
jgi:hypothetical protein